MPDFLTHYDFAPAFPLFLLVVASILAAAYYGLQRNEPPARSATGSWAYYASPRTYLLTKSEAAFEIALRGILTRHRQKPLAHPLPSRHVRPGRSHPLATPRRTSRTPDPSLVPQLRPDRARTDQGHHRTQRPLPPPRRSQAPRLQPFRRLRPTPDPPPLRQDRRLAARRNMARGPLTAPNTRPRSSRFRPCLQPDSRPRDHALPPH